MAALRVRRRQLVTVLAAALVVETGIFIVAVIRWRQEKATEMKVHLAVKHAVLLSAGDFDSRGDPMGRPYHLARLIELGEDAGPVLVCLLSDAQLTPFEYRGDAASFGSEIVFQGDAVHTATVADLAAYALANIYGYDMGFRSYLPEGDRRKAAAAWRKFVAAEGGTKKKTRKKEQIAE